MNVNLQNYSKKHIHFIEMFDIPILENLIRSFNKPFSLIDLGCGDDRLIYTLYNKGLLKNTKVVGVDLSKERIKRFKKLNPFAKGFVLDVCDLKKIKDNSFDLVISSQVVEHVFDDEKMLNEVYRILKHNGYFYVSTVVKKWYGFWIYYKKGFKLDPTHIREYGSPEEFLNILKEKKFRILKWKTNKIFYPLSDLIIRGLISFGLIKPNPKIYISKPFIQKIRNLIRIRVIGYLNIEVVCKVNK